MLLMFSCSLNDSDTQPERSVLEFGGDFSIMKKMEDAGGLYKIDGIVKEGLEIFNDNGYSWARLRIFHTPNMVGPVCNDLNYTIELAQKAKKYGFKILLNFHYSDTWADPGHQSIPVAWQNLSLELVQDSLYNYTRSVIEAMGNADVLPDMVQIGNEVNNGMMWPQGKLWIDSNVANWDNLSALLKTGVRGVKEAIDGGRILIMIHAANGGDVNTSYKFYKNIIDRGVEFDIIGLSYYPWWHGTFTELEANLLYLSNKFYKDFSIVETAYYSKNWYPEPTPWKGIEPPFPPTEQGQNDFLEELARVLKQNSRVKTLFYWKPDALEIPKTKVNYLGRSLFDEDGDAFLGISAWKDVVNN